MTSVKYLKYIYVFLMSSAHIGYSYSEDIVFGSRFLIRFSFSLPHAIQGQSSVRFGSVVWHTHAVLIDIKDCMRSVVCGRKILLRKCELMM